MGRSAGISSGGSGAKSRPCCWPQSGSTPRRMRLGLQTAPRGIRRSHRSVAEPAGGGESRRVAVRVFALARAAAAARAALRQPLPHLGRPRVSAHLDQAMELGSSGAAAIGRVDRQIRRHAPAATVTRRPRQPRRRSSSSTPARSSGMQSSAPGTSALQGPPWRRARRARPRDPFQRTSGQDLLVLAKDLPSIGYDTYLSASSTPRASAPPAADLHIDEPNLRLENSVIAVNLDPVSGAIAHPSRSPYRQGDAKPAPPAWIPHAHGTPQRRIHPRAPPQPRSRRLRQLHLAGRVHVDRARPGARDRARVAHVDAMAALRNLRDPLR
jgi:hypothetical protein